MPAAAWLLFASLLALAKETSPTRTIMAINAGGDTTIAADGEVFERDRYYQGGVVSKKGKDLVINGTNSPALYQTERFAIGEELWYSLPIPFNVGHNGRGWTFVLTLKFVEVQFNATGRRMFGVNLNGLHVLRDIDVFSMVGWATAYDEHIEFRIDPDHYAIWVTSVGPMRVRIEQPAAFYGDLHVALTPTEFGNARLCAMQLTQGTLEELDVAAEQSDPQHRRLSSKKKKRAGGDDSLFTLRTALLLLVGGTALVIAVRELLAWKFKKRALPAKLREKVGSQPASGRRAKGERDTPSKSQKKKGPERSNSSDASNSSEQSTKHEPKPNKGSGKGNGKASPDGQKHESKTRPESPRTQQKREERSRQKKEQRDKQKEKSRQESMRAEAEALSKAKAAAQNAARRSAAALAALEEATAAEAAREAVVLREKAEEAAVREKAEEAAARREAAKEAELAARAEAKQAKAKLKKQQRKAAAKLKGANGNAGTGSPAPSAQEQATKQQRQAQSSGRGSGATSKGGGKLPSSGSSGSLSSLPDTFQSSAFDHSLGVDWSHTADGGGGGGSTMVSRLSSGSFDSDEQGATNDNGDLDIDVFAVLQDEIMSRESGGAGGEGPALDESRLLSNLIDFLDTDESDSESLADSSYSGEDFFGGPLGGASAMQLSASAPEFTPTFPTEDQDQDQDLAAAAAGSGYDVSSLSVEVWMEAHELSQYSSNLLDAGLKTVGDLLEMPLTHDHLKSLGLTKLRGRLLLMNSLKVVLQGNAGADAGAAGGEESQ